jgi:hypothetical protein
MEVIKLPAFSPPALAGTEAMEIKRSGSQTSRKAPAEYFTGAVRVDPQRRASPRLLNFQPELF